MSLTSSATFTVAAAAPATTSTTIPVLPPLTTPTGLGQINHPILGLFNYTEKPDQWVNIDTDAIIPPVWSSVKTLSSSANVLWQGNIRDVTIEERWTQALSMSVTQLRMLMSIWTNPVDPSLGYVTWSPTYINAFSYNVIPMKLSIGGQDSFVFDDVVNTLDIYGNPDGWITNPVTFTMKLIAKVS